MTKTYWKKNEKNDQKWPDIVENGKTVAVKRNSKMPTYILVEVLIWLRRTVIKFKKKTLAKNVEIYQK